MMSREMILRIYDHNHCRYISHQTVRCV